MTMQRFHCALLVAAAVLIAASCGDPEEKIIYRDHPVEFDEDSDPYQVEGDPLLTLGVVEDGQFVELSDGSEVEILDGLQGGNWVHISLRATGVAADGAIVAAIGDLGAIDYPFKLARSGESYLEAIDVPIPIRPDSGDVEPLDGQTVDLSVQFTSRGTTIEQTLNVVLVRR